MSALDRVPSPGALLVLLFMAMFALATFIFLTHSDVAVQLLGLCIPLGGVLMALTVLSKENSRPKRAVAIALGLACVVSFYLTVTGDGPFSNVFVDAVIVGSALAVKGLKAKNGENKRPTPSANTEESAFWDDPKSALPDSESVLIVALLAVGTVVFLDAAGFHAIANLKEGVRHADPEDVLWPVAFVVGSKVVSLVRYRLEESATTRDERVVADE